MHFCSIRGQKLNSGRQPGDFGQWPERPESVRVFRCLISGRPDVIAGQIDVLPAKGRQMREQLVWDLLGRAQGDDGAVEIAGGPKDDGRDEQVQPDARCCWFS